MDSPFFSSHWKNFPPRPRYSSNVREFPVHRPEKLSPKVVSIPVHFLGSERSRSDSAMKIQKVFRGFLVRRSMKNIAAIKREVDEIEMKMSQRETVELIRKDPKERLRLNETLMSLLFRLDSVRGVDSGVRDCRKAVIKKAIALQERVDAIVAAGDEATAAVDDSSGIDNVESITEAGDQAIETNDFDDKPAEHTTELESEAPEVDPTPESFADNSNSSEIDLDRTLEKGGQAPEIEDSAPLFAEDCNSELQNHHEAMPSSNVALEATGETLKLEALSQTDDKAVKTEEKEESAMADMDTVMKAKETFEGSDGTSSETRSESGSSIDPQNPIGGVEEDGMEIVQPDKDEEKVKENSSCRAREDNKRSKQLVEKMMEDNEKLMGLMAELYERNEIQTRLLSSLTQRVEQLERAFVCDKLRKKKKRRGAVECLEKCPNATKKCGKQ